MNTQLADTAVPAPAGRQPGRVAVVGGGPAGLMAASVLSEAGLKVEIFEAKSAIGLKFLLAGRGGLNLTNAEPIESFVERYGNSANLFRKFLVSFSPAHLQAWLHALGVETFVGGSGRIFPVKAEAREILEICAAKLRERGAVFHLRHRWLGFAENGAPLFHTGANKTCEFQGAGLVLALGGASWPQTGSDGSWTRILAAEGIRNEPFRPANCGLEVAWSEHFRSRFSGSPLKNVRLRVADRQASGDVIITDYGLEGGPIYALSATARDLLEKNDAIDIFFDLKPDLDLATLERRLAHKRGRKSQSNYLRKTISLTGPAYSLLREMLPPETFNESETLAARIKNLPVPVEKTRPLAEAISSAGGLAFTEVNDDLMLHKLPGVFVAGEMLNWEAPTGGYLLQGAFTTGYLAAQGLLQWLNLPVNPSQDIHD